MSVVRRAVPSLAVILLCTATAGRAAAAPLNLHRVNWRDVSLPGSACDASGTIRLHDGAGSIRPVPSRWAGDIFRPSDTVTVGASLPDYGDLLGADGDVVGISVDCNNGGGTADGVLLNSFVIFRALSGHLSVVGVIKPQVQPAEVLPTDLLISIHRGSVTVREGFYGPMDATCCSTGRSTTTWTYSHGRLTPGTPDITTPAST